MGLPAASRFVFPIRSIVSKGLFPAVLLGSAVLRVIHLGTQSLWFDETYTAYVAQQTPERMIQFLVTDGVHPPLYYGFMSAWIRLFGDSAWSLRIPSAIAGALAVLMIYLLVRRMAGESEAILAAILTGASPFLVWHSQDARMYSMECLAAVAAVFFFWNTLQKTNWPNLIGLVITHAVLYGVHYFGVFLLLAELFFLILFWRKYLRCLVPFLLAQAMAVLPLILWGYTLLHRADGSFGIGWIPKPGWADPVLTLLNFFFANGGLWDVPAVIGGAGLALLLGLSLLSGKQKEAVWMGILWLILPIGMAWTISQTLPIYIDRYMILALPAAVLLVSIGACSLQGWKRYILPGILLGAMVPGLWNMNVPTSLFRKEEWREAAESIRAQFQPADLLLLRIYQEAVPLSYYGLLDRDWKPVETNREIALPELDASVRVCYLVYWLPSQSAHTFGTPIQEEYSEKDPLVSGWMEKNLRLLRAENNYPGIVVLIYQPARR